MSRQLLIPATLALVLCGALASAEDAKDAKELDSYLLVADEFAVRKEDAADAVYHSSNLKAVTAKLKELGVNPPDSVGFPEGGLFVLVVSDHTGEAFESLSMIARERLLIVGLMKDEEGGGKPGAAPAGKKNSRVLLVACPPQRGLKAFAIKTADGELHEVKGTNLEKK